MYLLAGADKEGKPVAHGGTAAEKQPTEEADHVPPLSSGRLAPHRMVQGEGYC